MNYSACKMLAMKRVSPHRLGYAYDYQDMYVFVIDADPWEMSDGYIVYDKSTGQEVNWSPFSDPKFLDEAKPLPL